MPNRLSALSQKNSSPPFLYSMTRYLQYTIWQVSGERPRWAIIGAALQFVDSLECKCQVHEERVVEVLGDVPLSLGVLDLVPLDQRSLAQGLDARIRMHVSQIQECAPTRLTLRA
jgi:hypothetical protein